MKIDLHGYTTHDGWREFRIRVEQCYFNGVRSIVVVTGHGQMQREIKIWCHRNKYVKEVQDIPHNAGAVKVLLNRKKTPMPPADTHQNDMSVLVKKLQKKYN
jgi:DNA-nicking Smr family endonuclease